MAPPISPGSPALGCALTIISRSPSRHAGGTQDQNWTRTISQPERSGDGTGKIYQLDKTGKLLGWAQTGLGMGQTGCIIHELYAESDNVLYRGSCSEWDIKKITIKLNAD